MFEDTKEQWKDIDGLEGEYAISSKGRVQNLKTGKLIGEGYNNDGYRRITLKGKPYYIHRLVALAFLDNPDNLPEVDHVDECKENNNASNLRWVSKSENTKHSSHKYSCQVKQIDKDGNLIKIWPSIKQIERELGYHRSAIINVCKKKLRYAYNFQWEYTDTSQQHKFNRQVIAFKGTEYVGEFANAAKASEALGLCYQSVYKCLTGCQASNKGYTFTYK